MISKKKVLSVIGARPQFIKISVLAPELEKKFNHIIVHSGQHYDYEMSKMFFNDFKIPKPDYNLKAGSGSHAVQTAKILEGCERVFLKEKPDIVIVYGDTNTTLAAALAAAKLKIPVCHVDAGARWSDLETPEEVNRIVTDHISSYLFAPSLESLNNLKKENLKNYFTSGDLMVDALKKVKLDNKFLAKRGLEKNKYIYVTIHRGSNVDDRSKLLNILNAINNLDKIVYLPLHPRTRKNIKNFKLKEKEYSRIHFDNPISYNQSITAINGAYYVITDSGSVPREAYQLNKLSVLLRNTTENKILAKLKWHILTDPEGISTKLSKLKNHLLLPKSHPNIFGNGSAAVYITNTLAKHLYGK